jgi:hypothetical protein
MSGGDCAGPRLPPKKRKLPDSWTAGINDNPGPDAKTVPLTAAVERAARADAARAAAAGELLAVLEEEPPEDPLTDEAVAYLGAFEDGQLRARARCLPVKTLRLLAQEGAARSVFCRLGGYKTLDVFFAIATKKRVVRWLSDVSSIPEPETDPRYIDIMDSIFGIMCREAARGHIYGTAPLLLSDRRLTDMLQTRVYRLRDQYKVQYKARGQGNPEPRVPVKSTHTKELAAFLDYVFDDERRTVRDQHSLSRYVFDTLRHANATAAALSICHHLATWVASSPTRITEVLWGAISGGEGHCPVAENIDMLADAFSRYNVISQVGCLSYFKDCHAKQVSRNGCPFPAPFYDMLLRVPAALCQTWRYTDPNTCSGSVTRDISFLVTLGEAGAITQAQLVQAVDEIIVRVVRGCEMEGVKAPLWVEFVGKMTDTHVTRQLRSLVVGVAHAR